jgi:hypothetical protein
MPGWAIREPHTTFSRRRIVPTWNPGSAGRRIRRWARCATRLVGNHDRAPSEQGHTQEETGNKWTCPQKLDRFEVEDFASCGPG